MMTETSDYETYKYDLPEESYNDRGCEYAVPTIPYRTEQETKDAIDGNRRWRKSQGLPRADWDIDKRRQPRQQTEKDFIEASREA